MTTQPWNFSPTSSSLHRNHNVGLVQVGHTQRPASQQTGGSWSRAGKDLKALLKELPGVLRGFKQFALNTFSATFTLWQLCQSQREELGTDGHRICEWSRNKATEDRHLIRANGGIIILLINMLPVQWLWHWLWPLRKERAKGNLGKASELKMTKN